tara:strand:+ start:1895 stop:2023 length:129 start_codon:yes stop_codon:yes gene_type:complete
MIDDQCSTYEETVIANNEMEPMNTANTSNPFSTVLDAKWVKK